MSTDPSRRVLVALSGGVDSSVCALLLQRAGYEVSGLVLKLSPCHASAVEAAELAADALGIGSCLIARAEETFATERGKEVQSAWGLDETYEAKLHVLLGYSAEEPRTAKPRRDGRRILVK